MHILLTGGGSGGHVTPLLAVAHELTRKYPDIELSYIGEKNGKFGRLIEDSNLFKNVSYISAGKLRRYHDESILQRLLDVKTNFLNFIDAFKTIIGLFEARSTIKKLAPDAVLAKGGFVCVPVGLVASRLNIPYMTHDSDAIPGLANRIISKKAILNATALPSHYYTYPEEKSVYTGIPVAEEFLSINEYDKDNSRKNLGIPNDALVVLITGGSQGSTRINLAIRTIIIRLLDENDKLYVVHAVGETDKELYDGLNTDRVISKPFFDNFSSVVKASDVVITRAGASSMAEFAALSKACIVIPSPFLAGGHQLENAKELAKAKSVVIVNESDLTPDSEKLLQEISKLLKNKKDRIQFGEKLHSSIKLDASEHIADLLVKIASKES